jgi:transposase
MLLTEVQRRRRFYGRARFVVVQETNQPGMTVSRILLESMVLLLSLLFHWRTRMAEGGKKAVAADDEVVASAEVKELQDRIRELERVLG